MNEDKKEEMVEDAGDEFVFKEYADKAFKLMFPGTYKSMEDEYEFEAVTLYDTGLVLIETDEEDFEKELSPELRIEIINYLLKRLMSKLAKPIKGSNEEDDENRDNDLMFR